MPAPRLRLIPIAALVLVGLAVGLAIRTVPSVEAQRPVAAPRHVILVSLDTLRADHLGSYGYDRATSPRLDELARESVVFRRAVAQGSSTIPSHASLFTGQYASAVLSEFGGMLGGAETLAEVLAKNGYATWGFVDGGNVRGHFGFDQGFDHYEDDRVGIEVLVEQAQAWIESHPAPKFFLFLHTYDIHTPYKAPAQYVKHFGNPDYLGGFHPNTRYFRAVEKAGRGLSEEEHHEVVARYDAGILYTDERVGGFFDWLDEKGLLEDSLVVITSDHGEEFLEHGRLGHQQLFLDPNLRVPLLFRHGRLAPRTVDDTVELTDVVPTILDVLGLEPLPDAIGTTLRPYFDGRARPSRAAFSEKGAFSGKATLITDRYQVLVDRESDEVSLYDLETDPAAEHDIAADHPQVAAELAAELGERKSHAVHKRQENMEATRVWKRPKAMKEKVRKELEALGYLEP